MNSLRQKTEAKIEQGRQANPEFMKNVDNAIQQAKAISQGEKAIKPGQLAPMFDLPDAQGKATSLCDLLVNGPVIVTFYRGSWCPYCNLQLRALQDKLADFKTFGAQLIAISPQLPDESMTDNEIYSMGFSVLSDQNARVAEQYGVAWKVPEVLLEHMRVDRGLDLEAINNGNGSILPIPGTFIINTNRVVSWHYIDVDYRTRAEPDDIINALRALVA